MEETVYEEQHAAFQIEVNKFMQHATKFMEVVRREQSTFASHKAVLQAVRAEKQKLLEDMIQLSNQLALQPVMGSRSATS